MKVPVKILHDTAAFDSFIQTSVLPFSEESDTGCSVPVLGKILQVPLHNVMLPIEGITLILGNGMAAGRVWADVLPPPFVSSVPLVRKQPDENEVNFPEVFGACVVTHSMTHANLDSVSGSENFKCDSSEKT